MNVAFTNYNCKNIYNLKSKNKTSYYRLYLTYYRLSKLEKLFEEYNLCIFNDVYKVQQIEKYAYDGVLNENSRMQNNM